MRITKTFRNLNPDKQKQIINAALHEFTEKGFEHASTNQIVKHAGIGKGMLFYYFKSKKDLYIYLIDYCMDITERKYLAFIDSDESDLFERLKQMSRLKQAFLKKYPHAINFMTKVLLQSPEQIGEDIKKQMVALQEKAHAKMYGNVDYTLFRKDIDAEKAFQLINWTIQGYEEDIKLRLRANNVNTPMDFEVYFEEFYEYLDVLKIAFYSR